MSFGFGVGDIVKLGKLPWQVYKALSTAPDVFKTLVMEVSSMHTVLQLVKEALEQQEVPETLQRGLLGIALICEAVLKDAQKLVEKYKSLGTVKSRRIMDRAGMAMENVADLRSKLISATSLLTAFQTTLHGRSHAKILETLECLRKDVRAGNREGSVLSNLVIEDLQNDKQDIWREVIIELEDAGLDPEVIHEERRLITGWFEKALSNGGFDEGSVADSTSERTASPTSPVHSNPRQNWESVDSLALLLPQPLVNDNQNSSNLSVDGASYVSSSSISSVRTTRSPLIRKPVARVLDNNEIRIELAKLNDLVSYGAVALSTKLAPQVSPTLDNKLQPQDVDIDAIIYEDQRNAVDHEGHIRIQKSKLERRMLPLPWGWVFDSSTGLYCNKITSDTASNLPLLNIWSFAVMSHELLPRCIQATRNNFEIINNLLLQQNDSIQAVAIEASRSIETLLKAISKFGIFLETSHPAGHICTQLMLLTESNRNDELLQSVLESDLLLAHNVYPALMRQILSWLHAFSLIFGSKNSPISDRSRLDHIMSSWRRRKMIERMALLEQQVNDEEYWRPVEIGLRRIWSWYNINSLEVENKSAKLASIWSQFYKTKQGAGGDNITIQIHSAVSTTGEQLEKAHLPLDRIGSIIAAPLVPLDTVCYLVRVLVDGLLLFQTAEDERVSPFSRFLWNSTRTFLATNCQYIDFELWDHDAMMGFKRRNVAQARGRIPFKFPLSSVARLCNEDLSKNVNRTIEVEMISEKTGKLWGVLRVGLSWEGRDVVAAKVIATEGIPIEASHSEVVGHMFAHSDYTKISRRTDLVSAKTGTNFPPLHKSSLPAR